MSQFSITLPGKRQAQVKSGKVFLKGFLGRILSPQKNISKTGYFVRTETPGEGLKESILYQAKDGKWSLDPEGQKEPEENTIESEIKKAIEVFESQH
ncbi:MAG: hypothetical protein J0I41_10965 [Filimonas sp.]|nr:hypothetical protein [Filimonas sp.]